ncbi:hypothetical protein ACQR7C_09830 [Salmonella enterica]|uniref:hypothetical protein n=1 Tax=Salmonella enterica TaxID=28901 RepID=UPI003D2F215F
MVDILSVNSDLFNKAGLDLKIKANRLITNHIIACNPLLLIYCNSHYWLMAITTFYYHFSAIFDIVAVLNAEE